MCLQVKGLDFENIYDTYEKIRGCHVGICKVITPLKYQVQFNALKEAKKEKKNPRVRKI